MDKLLTNIIIMIKSTNPPTDNSVSHLNNMNHNQTPPASEFQSSLTPRVTIRIEPMKHSHWER